MIKEKFSIISIFLIKLNLSRDWPYNLITLKLLFFLDASFDKRITFEIMASLLGKKPLKPNRKLRKKP